MAKKDEAIAVKQQATEEQATEERFEVMLNPALELAGYTFSDGVGFNEGSRYSLTRQQMEKYGEKKLGGNKLLIKA
jgi:hypothetical protein